MEEFILLEAVEERNEDDVINAPEEITNTHSIENLNLLKVEEERNEDDDINAPQYLEIFNSPCYELQREKIAIKRLLGSGNFGEVYKATLGKDTVAVKSLKGRYFTLPCRFGSGIRAGDDSGKGRKYRRF